MEQGIQMTGTEFDTIIAKLKGPAREQAILNAIKAGHVPQWYRNTWIPVQSGPLTFYVKPDYFVIGDETNYRRIPMTPQTAQAIANGFNSILPSRRMVDLIYAAPGSVQIKPHPFPPDDKMEESFRFVEHDASINASLTGSGYGSVPKELRVGHKKDIVVGPDLDGSRVAIYGWHTAPGKPIQPYSTIHGSYYADYAHGVRLVSRQTKLDGKPIDIMTAFREPSLVPLVSDQGSFVPVFPSKGAKWPEKGSSGGGGVVAGAMVGFAVGGPLGGLVGGIIGAVTDGKKT